VPCCRGRVGRHTAQVERVGKFYIEGANFALKLDANPKNSFRVADIPIGGAQRLGGMIGWIPKKFIRFVLHLGRINFKHLPLVDLDQHKSLIHLYQQRVALLSCLKNAPDFHGRVIQSQDGIVDFLP